MTYTHLARRATALACFLGPALLIVGSLLYLAQPGSGGLFVGPVVFNDPIHKLEWAFCNYFGLILLIPALFALAAIVGQRMQRLAVNAAAMGLLGICAALSSSYMEVYLAAVDRSGVDMSWLSLIPSSGPNPAQLIVGFPIILFFLSMVVMGYGVLRTGVLPRWAGALLIAAGLLQFDATGPQPSGLPLLTWLLAALCLAVVYAQVGARLWRGEGEPALAGQAARVA